MKALSANLRWLFLEWPYYERIEIAAKIGFKAVDFSLPYAFAAKEMKTRLDATGLEFVYMLTPSGNWDAGERGIAALAGREREFRDGVALALEYATALGCPLIHAASGILPAGADRARCRETYLENLAFACDRAAACGVTVAIEPLCHQAHAGFFLLSTADAEHIVRELKRDNLRLIFDTYHAAMEEGAITPVLERLHGLIAHFQVANPPARNEPGAGELDFDFLFRELERLGYAGWVSAEYRPTQGTLRSLAWARPFGVAPEKAN